MNGHYAGLAYAMSLIIHSGLGSKRAIHAAYLEKSALRRGLDKRKRTILPLLTDLVTDTTQEEGRTSASPGQSDDVDSTRNVDVVNLHNSWRDNPGWHVVEKQLPPPIIHLIG